MESLKQKIIKEGKLLGGNIVKVDSFLNHQIDTRLMYDIGNEFYERYKTEKITKIVTIESSGIAVALTTAHAFNVPVVFAKKQHSLNIGNNCYKTRVYSFTKKIEYDVTVSCEYIKNTDRVLIIDDFLASGNALNGLISILNESGAEIVGVGIVIEKTFQNGGKELRQKGIRIESLAKIMSIGETEIIFAKD